MVIMVSRTIKLKLAAPDRPSRMIKSAPGVNDLLNISPPPRVIFD
jgi:hypothetical protein